MRRYFILTISLCFAIAASSPASAQKRLALVIGVQNYQHLPQLRNTLADAESVAKSLQEAGFELDVARDVSQTDLSRAIRDFARKVEAAGPDTVALFYYAGHGVQNAKQDNFLIGVDADLRSEVDLPIETLPIKTLLHTLEEARPKILFAIFDACRDSPLPATARGGATRGLAPEVDLPPGVLIGYATAPGAAAEDGGPAGHSPFAAAFIEEVQAPGVEATRMFRLVTRKVLDRTQGRQHPWVEDQRLTEDFFFHPGASAADNKPPAIVPDAPQMSALDRGEIDYGIVVNTDAPEAYEEWLKKYPNHPKGDNVRALLQRLREENLGNGPKPRRRFRTKSSG